MSEASRDFRATFDPEKQSIEEALGRLDKVPKDELQTNIDSIVQRIHALEKTAIKAMSEKLAQLRVKLVPKTKFSFKSRKTAGATPSPTSTPRPIASPKHIASTPTIDQSLFLKFEDRTGEHLFIGSLSLPLSGAGAGAAKDVALTNLTDCTINLVHDIPLGAIHVKNLKRCTLVFPPVSGSILLHDCEGCTVVGACHQSRMHTSTNMNIYIHVTSEPIIEDCTDMRFAPYGQILPVEELDRLFEAAQLNRSVNLYDRVKDFNWLRQQQSPNWRLLEESEQHPEVFEQVLSKDRSVAE
ncbi:hypothetical protein BGZ95_001812 [Linnemannia exigua]|uniref:C-CAP/cofactor C-like domain-containing protein n=1 Tax=Linnemannia exigua TaxID=604196 RepID=A0AAD4D6E1_9FUNG|nr:hypothetical protein BGZ95_001812 [Linnemannia exigua]